MANSTPTKNVPFYENAPLVSDHPTTPTKNVPFYANAPLVSDHPTPAPENKVDSTTGQKVMDTTRGAISGAIPIPYGAEIAGAVGHYIGSNIPIPGQPAIKGETLSEAWQQSKQDYARSEQRDPKLYVAANLAASIPSSIVEGEAIGKVGGKIINKVGEKYGPKVLGKEMEKTSSTLMDIGETPTRAMSKNEAKAHLEAHREVARTIEIQAQEIKGMTKEQAATFINSPRVIQAQKDAAQLIKNRPNLSMTQKFSVLTKNYGDKIASYALSHSVQGAVGAIIGEQHGGVKGALAGVLVGELGGGLIGVAGKGLSKVAGKGIDSVRSIASNEVKKRAEQLSLQSAAEKAKQSIVNSKTLNSADSIPKDEGATPMEIKAEYDAKVAKDLAETKQHSMESGIPKDYAKQFQMKKITLEHALSKEHNQGKRMMIQRELDQLHKDFGEGKPLNIGVNKTEPTAAERKAYEKENKASPLTEEQKKLLLEKIRSRGSSSK